MDRQRERVTRRELYAFRVRLARWFDRHRRDFPWRVNRTPYRVWVSEMMLQQTRTAQAEPYYRRFLRRFPSLRALARAASGDVLKAWEGLGYYRRALALHAGARWIQEHHGGRFPRDAAAIRALPGVGSYTAAAIGSLAMGLPLAALDGNAIRVLSRVFAMEHPPWTAAGRRRFEQRALRLLPPGRAGAFNEALMELGALCCRPREPACAGCPLRGVCRAAAAGTVSRYPRRPPARVLPHREVGAAVIVNTRGEILLAQRRREDMLGGLWEFPGGTREPGESIKECIAREVFEELGLRITVGARLVTVRHAYSHFRITLVACRARPERGGRPRALQCADWAWVPRRALGTYPLSRADWHIRDAVAAVRWPRRTPRGVKPTRR